MVGVTGSIPVPPTISFSDNMNTLPLRENTRVLGAFAVLASKVLVSGPVLKIVREAAGKHRASTVDAIAEVIAIGFVIDGIDLWYK
jgi:hypothetical protein